MESPGVIKVIDPLTKRFLFDYDPIARQIVTTHRSVTTTVDLAKLERNAADKTAIVSTNAPRADGFRSG
jgi:hypothetical protein